MKNYENEYLKIKNLEYLNRKRKSVKKERISVAGIEDKKAWKLFWGNNLGELKTTTNRLTTNINSLTKPSKNFKKTKRIKGLKLMMLGFNL